MKILHTDREPIIDKTKEQEVIPAKQSIKKSDWIWGIIFLMITIAALIIINNLNKNKNENSSE